MHEPFRIMSRDGEIGWGSSFGGEVATLITLEEVLGSWPPAQPDLAVVVPGGSFTSDVLTKLTNKVAAVVVSTNTSHSRPVAGSSQAQVFPNREWGIDPNSRTLWNPTGDGLLRAAPGYALLSVRHSDWLNLADKARNNLDRWPRWAVTIKSFMWGTTDSETCIRRRFCDPMGGTNVLASATAFNQTTDSDSVVLATVSVDSDAAVRYDAVGARAVSSAIALLGALEAISHCNAASGAAKIVYAFSDADQWGYCGVDRGVRRVSCARIGTRGRGRSPSSSARLRTLHRISTLKGLPKVQSQAQRGYCLAQGPSLAWAVLEVHQADCLATVSLKASLARDCSNNYCSMLISVWVQQMACRPLRYTHISERCQRLRGLYCPKMMQRLSATTLSARHLTIMKMLISKLWLQHHEVWSKR